MGDGPHDKIAEQKHCSLLLTKNYGCVVNAKALSIMRYQDDINYWAQHEVNMPRVIGSVDKAPASQWIYARSIREAHIFDIKVEWATVPTQSRGWTT